MGVNNIGAPWANIVADIRARERRLANGERSGGRFAVSAILNDYADRIEAAAKRERGGNAAAMRQTIVEVRRQMRDEMNDLRGTSPATAHALEWYAGLLKKALREPARNCDVGSPTEQAERFKRFCDEHTDSGKNPSCGMCPILPVINRGGTKELCPFYWGQMTCLETDGEGQD